jgi:hypothetical protein
MLSFVSKIGPHVDDLLRIQDESNADPDEGLASLNLESGIRENRSVEAAREKQ